MCKKEGISYTRFDYFGHGQSEGGFEDGSITIWKQNTIDIVKNVSGGTPQILVGSSLGGWLAILAALELKSLVNGIVGIAAAPDFTNDMQNALDASSVKALNSIGYLKLDRYGQQIKITKKLLEDGQKNLVLNQEAIDIDCKAVFLHGMSDNIVHYKKSIECAKKIASKDVEVTLLKDADHNMKDEKSLKVLSNSILTMVK